MPGAVPRNSTLDLDRDRLIGGDAIEIGMEDILPERIPLVCREQRLLGDALSFTSKMRTPCRIAL